MLFCLRTMRSKGVANGGALQPDAKQFDLADERGVALFEVLGRGRRGGYPPAALRRPAVTLSGRATSRTAARSLLRRSPGVFTCETG